MDCSIKPAHWIDLESARRPEIFAHIVLTDAFTATITSSDDHRFNKSRSLFVPSSDFAIEVANDDLELALEPGSPEVGSCLMTSIASKAAVSTSKRYKSATGGPKFVPLHSASNFSIPALPFCLKFHFWVICILQNY